MRTTAEYRRKAEEYAHQAERCLTEGSRRQLDVLAEAFAQLSTQPDYAKGRLATDLVPSRRNAFLKWLAPHSDGLSIPSPR